MSHHNHFRRILGIGCVLIFLAGCATYTPAPPLVTPRSAPATLVTLPASPAPIGSDWTGSVTIEQGRCCIGGVADTTIQAQVEFAATSPAGKVSDMRVISGSGSCASESAMQAATWEPFVPSKSYPVGVGINWVGFQVSAQFRDEAGNVSPVYCDDISVEGSPAIPEVNPTDWYAQIQCFSESDVHPSGGETVTGPTVTFSWPGKNRLPDGVFYRVNAYGASDNYTALIASGQTRDTSLELKIPADRAGDIVWYIVLADANGTFLDHGRCSSFPASLLNVNPPSGIKGVHFMYQP